MQKRNGVLAALAIFTAISAAFGENPATKPAAAKLPFTISKETTAITAPLRTDGWIDYVAALNEKYGKGVTPENNGFVVWLKLAGTGNKMVAANARAPMLKLLGVVDAGDKGGSYLTYGAYLAGTERIADPNVVSVLEDKVNKAAGMLWTADDFPQLAKYLTHEEKNLKLAAEAAARERWWSPYVGDSMVGVKLPALGPMREVVNMWCARATLRAGAGDFAGFLADIRAARQMARHVGGGATVIERLVGVAMESQACRAIGAVAGSGKLSAEQCAELLKMMDQDGPLPTMVEAVDVSERWNNLDEVRLFATGQAVLIVGEDNAKRFADIASRDVDWDVVLKTMNGVVDEEVAAMKPESMQELRDGAGKERMEILSRNLESENKRNLGKREGEPGGEYIARVTRAIILSVASDMMKAEELYRRAVMEEKMARAVVGLAAMHAKDGKWPAHLKEIVPAYLKESVRDIYSERGQYDVIYDVTKNGVRLYSVGRNGMDDGGVMDREKNMDDIVIGVLQK